MERADLRAAAGMAVVRLENVGKSYAPGAEILHDVSLALESREFCFVSGASGAGKTTPRKLLCLAEPAAKGAVTVFDTANGALSRSARAALPPRIGGVFQNFR